LSEHTLFIIEKILSKGADVPGVGLYWLAECITGTYVMPVVGRRIHMTLTVNLG